MAIHAWTTALLAASISLSACSEERPGIVREQSPAAEYAAKEADDTGRNVRDREGTTLTPTDQSSSDSDVELTRKVRDTITSNDAMSMKARNVKVITQGGVVTLRGPVETENERAAIELAAQQAGATRIDNQLEIDRDGGYEKE